MQIQIDIDGIGLLRNIRIIVVGVRSKSLFAVQFGNWRMNLGL
jgi:hypothetical protein